MKPYSSTQPQPNDASLEQRFQQLQQEVAQLQQENEQLRQHANLSSVEHSLLEVTAQAANALLTIAPLEQAVNTALQILGESLDTDRIIVIENVDSFSESLFPSWRALNYEWTSSGTMPQYGNPEAAQGSYEEIPEIFEPLHQGQTFSFLIEEISEPFRSAQVGIGVKATHAVPIFVEGQWWGLLGLDDCREAKQRSATELSALKIAADCIGSAIERDRTQQALLQAEQERTRNAAKHSQELEQLNAELRQTLEHLTESEERYRTLFELSSEGIYRWELDQPISIASPVDEQVEQIRRSLYVAEANAAYAAMYGLPTTDAASGLRLSNAHILTSGKNFEFLRRWIENGYRIRAAESEEITPEGRRCYFFNNVIGIIEDGYLIGGWGTQLDISELRETQQALLEAEQKRSQELERINAELQQALNHLSESEEQFRTLFELSSEGFYYTEVDPPCPISLPIEEQCDLLYRNIRVVKANPAFAAMYGVDHPDELIGLRNADVHVPDSEKNAVFIRGTIENGYRFRNLETEEIDTQGRLRYFLNSGVYTIKDSCVVSGWGTQIDITELREIQQALLQAEQARVSELAKANEELQQREHEVQRSYRLLSTVAQVTKDLLEAEDIDVAIPAALQAVGEVANMSRVQLLVEYPDVSTQKLYHLVAYESVADGIVPQMDHPDAGTLKNDDFEFMLKDLHAGRSIWHIVEVFPSPIREQFESIGIKSCGAVPIFIEGHYVGSVSFDDCITPRQWSQQEIDVLTTAAESIGAALHRKQLVDRLIEERIRAEQERAAELAKANNALKQTVDVLATETDLNRFLGHVLQVIANQLDAPL
uniref:GAF domain-containing protein n=1 Tax=Oscillatoria sp. FACHB-1407 TaxID=2692847 RepID=UPI001683814F